MARWVLRLSGNTPVLLRNYPHVIEQIITSHRKKFYDPHPCDTSANIIRVCRIWNQTCDRAGITCTRRVMQLSAATRAKSVHTPMFGIVTTVFCHTSIQLPQWGVEP